MATASAHGCVLSAVNTLPSTRTRSATGRRDDCAPEATAHKLVIIHAVNHTRPEGKRWEYGAGASAEVERFMRQRYGAKCKYETPGCAEDGGTLSGEESLYDLVAMRPMCAQQPQSRQL